MKILIIRPLTRTALELADYCARSLTKLNHVVSLFNFRDSFPSLLRQVGLLYIEKSLWKTIRAFKPDLVMVIKCDRIPLGVIEQIRKRLRVPVVNYWIDDPLWIKVSSQLSPFYDFFFTNDPRSVEVHRKAGCPNVMLLTFGCDPHTHRTLELSEEEKKQYGSEVCFAGTIVSERERILEHISHLDLKVWWPPISQYTDENLRIEKKQIDLSLPLFQRFTGREVWGSEMVKVFNASKICLNIHSQGGAGTNMRTFEVTGSGGFLLCEFREALADLFKIGEELVCFHDPEELQDLTAYYLAHPQKREKIASRGQEKAYRVHTYVNRMQEMLSFIEKNRS